MKLTRKLAGLLITGLLLVMNSCEKSEPEISTNDRDAFIGSYAAQSTGAGGNRNFTLTITASSSAPDQIRMANFDGDPNVVIFATVSGTALSISSQSVSGETYQGTGNLSGRNISINFTVDDGQVAPESRVLNGVRQ